MLYPHCSSNFNITPSLDHHQTSTTGNSLHLWHHYTIISPTLHHHTSTNSTTPFLLWSLQYHFINTSQPTPMKYHHIIAPLLPLIQQQFKHIFQHHFIPIFPAHHHYTITTSKPLLQYYFNINAPPAPPVHYYFINSVPPTTPIHYHFTIITTLSPQSLHCKFTVTSLLPTADAN